MEKCVGAGPVAEQPSRARSTHPPVGPFRCARLGARSAPPAPRGVRKVEEAAAPHKKTGGTAQRQRVGLLMSCSRAGNDRRAHPSSPSPMSMEGTWKSGCSSVAMMRCACLASNKPLAHAVPCGF